MDKNTITGFVLIGLVLLGFSYFSRPSKEELQAAARQDSIAQVEQLAKIKQDSINKVALSQAKDSLQQVAASDSTKAFYQNRSGKAQEVILKNSKVEVGINTLGGTINQVRVLGKYKAQDKKSQVQLLTPKENQMVLTIEGKNENFNTQDYYFEPVAQTDSTVTMRLTAGNGGTLDLCYTLRGDSYMTDFTVKATNLDPYIGLNTKTMGIVWSDKCKQQEKGHTFENRYATLSYKEQEDGTDYLSATSEKTETPEQPLDWVAFKNQFFSCVLIGQQEFTKATLTSSPCPEKSEYLKEYYAEMQTYFDPTGKNETKMQMYLGPNDFHVLQEHDLLSSGNKNLDLEDMVDFGWPLLKWINRFFILYIFDWLTAAGLSMGMVLLVLTIFIKILVYPTTRKSFMSSARMRVLKPKLAELNQKYPNKEDAMKRQQEQMGLYQQYGVSPMGGCLPMLIQMPIWLALFNFVPNAIQLRGESFLWADDLSAYDDLLHWNADLWLIGDHISIFCLLFCLTNIGNAWISMRQQKDQMSDEQAQQMKMMQYMMFVMPVMFFFMFNNYASGLCYYYFLSGITSILIMWYLRKTTDDEKLLAQLEAYREAHKNDPKKLNSMMTRMAALQQQQEQLKKMQEQRKK